MNGLSWLDDAACAGMETDLFFPTHGEWGNEARKVCKTCPVVSECLAWARRFEVGQRIPVGVYGGMTGRERQRLQADA